MIRVDDPFKTEVKSIKPSFAGKVSKNGRAHQVDDTVYSCGNRYS